VGEADQLTSRRVVLQLDFDGTLTERDVNEVLFLHFLGLEWSERIERASHAFRTDPSSPALINTLQEATAQLSQGDEECMAYASRSVALRPGLQELIETAEELGIERHIVSYGFDFYITHYLRQAGVERRIQVHCGETAWTAGSRSLTYLGPDGSPLQRDFKMLWTRFLRRKADVLVYAGDGGSDVAPSLLADVVFARESLLSGMPSSYAGTIQPFETLHDVARGLRELCGRPT
jgi:2,3-diketo-5-methylthio-1-phosphopentane phosphatase